MYAKNFTYDGISLASLGYVMCEFGSSSDEAIGSTLTFSTVPIDKGRIFLLADSKYDSALTTTLYICKNPCHVGDQDSLKLSPSDVSSLSRWLNKKKFCPLIFDADGWRDVVFEASFNIKAYNIGGECYGLELEMITNRPFATKPSVIQTLTFVEGALTQNFTDTSDEIGYIYPDSIMITMGASGNLTLTNAIENRATVINNCIEDEIISINYPVITSDEDNHDILSDFNFVFPRIANTSLNRVNAITASLPCTIAFSYKPIIKIAL